MILKLATLGLVLTGVFLRTNYVRQIDLSEINGVGSGQYEIPVNVTGQSDMGVTISNGRTSVTVFGNPSEELVGPGEITVNKQGDSLTFVSFESVDTKSQIGRVEDVSVSSDGTLLGRVRGQWVRMNEGSGVF